MGKTKTRGKTTNPDSPAEDGTLSAEEDDDASNHAELGTDASTSTSEANSQPTLASILTAITKLEEDIMARFNGLDSKQQFVHTSLTDHSTRIADLEGAVTDHDTRITDLEQ